jgi:hypothetical protein
MHASTPRINFASAPWTAPDYALDRAKIPVSVVQANRRALTIKSRSGGHDRSTLKLQRIRKCFRLGLSEFLEYLCRYRQTQGSADALVVGLFSRVPEGPPGLPTPFAGSDEARPAKFLVRGTRNLHRMKLMSSKIKSPTQPIYPRAASSQPKLASAVQKTSLDAQAEEIRKAWLQRPPARSR